MTIAFNCPHCGHAFNVDDKYAGQTGPCAACNKPITIPGTATGFAPQTQEAPPPKSSSAPALIGILVGGAVIFFVCGGVLMALLLPAIQAAREAARRNQCINNNKLIGLSMHNHHDVFNKMPLASSQPVSGIPGSGDPQNPAGYSWTVALLPFMEESYLHDEMMKTSNRWQYQPFSPEMTGGSDPYPGCVSLNLLICPSGDGTKEVDIYNSDYETYTAMEGTKAPAVSNYLALAASHLTNSTGPAELFGIGGGVAGNGVFVFPIDPAVSSNKGLSFKAITDGTSKTVVFCESREAAYAAWIDGQATWGVGAWPENVDVPAEQTSRDGFLGFNDSDYDSITSLEAASEARYDDSMFYMAKERFGGGYDRMWGPSSQHTGGVVNHCFADGHVSSMTPDIDRNLYLRAISRSGGEPINLDY